MNSLIQKIKIYIEMNKPLIICLTVTMITIGGFNCTTQDDENLKPIIKSEKYEPCCGTPAEVNRELLPGKYLFIPNLFTPNGDGINDFFYPQYDSTLIFRGQVQNFTIFNSDNDQIKRSIFFRDWFNFDDIKNFAFNGYYWNEEKLAYVLWEGQFWYSMKVIVEGKDIVQITGSACSVVCDDESALFREKKDCFFPVQIKSNYYGDNTLSNHEVDCFK